MEILVVLTGSLTIVATAVPLVRGDAWWIRIFDFPRSQIIVLAAASLVAYGLVRTGGHPAGDVFLGLLAACVLYQGYAIFPYTVLARKQVQRSAGADPESRFSLVVANVLMYNRKASALREIIGRTDPDMLLTVETDVWWQDQLRELEPAYPFRTHCPLDNTYGILLYSRLELVESAIEFVVQEDVPSIHCVARLPCGQEVEFYFLHPRPPSPTEADRSTERDAELLIVGKAVRGSRRPVVVAGDLNDVAWCATTRLFQKISGLLDPRIGRGFYNTFHAKYPLLRWPLDHVFHSKDFRLIALKRLPYFGSDHFPVFISLNYEPSAPAEQEAPATDPGDREEAEAKIDRAAGEGE